MDELVRDLGDLGIYNCRPTRTGSTLSLHGEGRAWDCAIPSGLVALGDKTAQFFVDAAQELGVQRVIWGFGPNKSPKEWDSREGQRYWSNYSGPAHDDHIHVEVCWKSALELTEKQVRDAFMKHWSGAEEDELTEDEKKKLEFVYQAVKRDGPDGKPEGIDKWLDRRLKEILAAIQAG